MAEKQRDKMTFAQIVVTVLVFVAVVALGRYLAGIWELGSMERIANAGAFGAVGGVLGVGLARLMKRGKDKADGHDGATPD